MKMRRVLVTSIAHRATAPLRRQRHPHRCMNVAHMSTRPRNTRNPFEIQFADDGDDKPASRKHMETNPMQQPSTLTDEIQLFHDEMTSVFGSEPEEYDDGSSNSTRDRSSDNEPSLAFASETKLSPGNARNLGHHAGQDMPSWSSTERAGILDATQFEHGSIKSNRVVFIQGPCTYVQNEWVGSPNGESLTQFKFNAERIANSCGCTVSLHHSNHEGHVLDWVLNTPPGASIIINWNGRLEDSPAVYRALTLVDAPIIILAPLDVEIGPVPPCVKGIITGFGPEAIELAFKACK